ncbi:RAB11-binding protein RELCH homolog [Anabrus simplex]|uniref:RAB11-binding protein RELCH homolog n=1 Tax=Anabrus simplex TaxID=316456 RepID=UPI0035A3CBD5
MANPFEEEVDQERNLQYLKASSVNSDISYSDIATKLLNENLLLTALELHTELIEAGREVPKLKEFFSNPGNFEHQAATRPELTSIPRSSSQATLDSLDLARYSEDGERGVDERVAVLEFELRKAKETISALRANLTVATESETTTPDGDGSSKLPCNEPIKPHEQRALNFLLNEYLLQHGYKLTSITFADENENQDFEDWDDVGLNISKPAELLSLYRDFMRNAGHARSPCQSTACQTDPVQEDLKRDIQLQEMVVEVEQLKEQLSSLEQEKLELKRLWSMDNRLALADASIATTPGSDLGGTTAENVSMHSATPERFELLEADTKASEDAEGRTVLRGDDDGSAVSLADTDVEWTRLALPNVDQSMDTTPPVESSPEPIPDTTPCISLSSPMSRSLPAAFQREVLARCFINTSRQQDGHILDDMLNEGISEDRLVNILAQSLPRIIPNVILNKREEVIPLMICAIHLHPDATERDRLLNLLFNLKKKPQEEERRIILAGIVGIARCSGLSLVENEILPQCWEQLSHRHVERRLLVAEACSALAPYVSSSIRNSLMLSMLQQMLLEDKDETVREMVVRSLALIVTFMDDKDKYFQCEELAMTAMDDPSRSVVISATRILMPVVAKWALDLGRLQSHLLSRLLLKLKSQTKPTPPNSPSAAASRRGYESDQRIVYTVTVLQTLLPYLLMCATAVKPVLQRVGPDTLAVERSDWSKHSHGLTNPSVFYEGEFDVSLILGAFDLCVEEEGYEEWSELEWVSTHLLPDLLDVAKGVEVSHDAVVTAFIKLFSELCFGFGKAIVRQKVKPAVVQRLQQLEATLAVIARGDNWPPLALIPVYLVGVLATLPDQEGSEELGSMLKRFMCALAICGAPLEALEVSVRGLCEVMSLQELVVSTLWEGVVHPRSVVRVAAASLFVAVIGNISETLLTARVAPALVTLASDPDVNVRASTLPAFGALITNTSLKEIQDKTYMQLQSFLSDCSVRENHQMLMQLVITMGNIVTACEPWFREEVIIPQLCALSSFAELLSNQTRRMDLATVLIEAFSAAVYCSLSKHVISAYLLPGLRSLEPISSQSLHIHHETLLAMIRGAESRVEVQRPMERSGSISLASATANVNQGMEDMKQRVTKMFQKPAVNRPPNLSNLHGIFRKK